MPTLGAYHLSCEGDVPLLFTENETNHARLHLDYPDAGPYLKDGINDYVVHGRKEAVNPAQQGTKAAAHYQLRIGSGPVGDGTAALDRPGHRRSAPLRAGLRRDPGHARSGGRRILQVGDPVIGLPG